MLRLFIAVSLPKEIKNSIAKILSSLRPQFRGTREARFVPEENWHFTISFLGYQEEKVLPFIKDAMRKTADFLNQEAKNKNIIELEKLTYGPPDRPKRMIWVTGTNSTSERLNTIKNVLEENLRKNGVRWQRKDYEKFHAHLNLARFLPTSLKNLPVIDTSLSLKHEFSSIDLMQSRLSRGGAAYEKLFSADF